MKFGLRRPSIRKRLAARTSPKRVVRHTLGVKAPRGAGWVTDPKKALYNRIYNRTTVGVDSPVLPKRRGKNVKGSPLAGLVFLIIILYALDKLFF
jgi:hypothetical protein